MSETQEWVFKFVLDVGAEYDKGLPRHASRCDELNEFIQEQVRLARIDERNLIALDNYRGHTISDSTNYEAKFAKFISNNENRIKELKNE